MSAKLIDVRGVGSITAAKLVKHGIDSVETLARTSVEDVASAAGISPRRAGALKSSAVESLEPETKTEAPEAKKRDEKKEKKRKKAKDKGKEKPKKKGRKAKRKKKRQT